MNRRGLVAIATAVTLAGVTGLVASSSDHATTNGAGGLRGAVSVADAGHDTSAPLRALEGHVNDAEAEREREAAAKGESGGDGGEADKSVGDRPTKLTETERERLRRKPKYTEAHRPDRALQASTNAPSGRQMPAALANFAGVSEAQSGCGCLPPDTNGEIGPNDYVQTVNGAIGVFSRTGVARAGFPKPLNAIWANFNPGTPACRDSNDGDPVVLYDQFADRWVITQFALNGYFGTAPNNYECVAVSTTGDPTGTYYRYQFPFPVGQFNDYPKFGVWTDGYYATYNMFTNAGSWAGVNVIAYNRSRMLAGQSANLQKFAIGTSTNEGGLLPADIDGSTLPAAGAPAPMVEMQDATFGFPQDQVMIRRFHTDWTTPANSTLSAPTVLANAPFDSNLCNYDASCIKQPGTAQGLDALADRIMFRASYRRFANGHDSLLINGTVDTNGADRAGIRWTELANATSTTPSIVQQSTYSPDANSRWMASIAQDKLGDMAMGYSVSSSSLSPSLRYTGRLAGDALGQMTQGEATLVAGTGSQTSQYGRWGDYSDISMDPTDDCTFWYTSEYTGGVTDRAWLTRIGSFKFPSCTSGGQPTIAIGNASVVEGNSGTKTVNVPVTLSAASASPVSFTFSSANGTATAGSDYVAKTNISRTFPAGTTALTVSFTINGDTTPEPNETFTVNGSNPVGATFADNQGVVTITNDDGPVLPSITVSDVSSAEGNSGTTTFTIPVHLSAASTLPVSFTFSTANGTATAPSDYQAKSNITRTFPAGTTNLTLTILVNGDTNVEPNETFRVNLSAPVNATIGDNQAVVTVVNDD